MTRRKDTHEIIQWARRRGWTATRTASGHLRFTKADRPPVITGSSLAGRNMANARADLARNDRHQRTLT